MDKRGGLPKAIDSCANVAICQYANVSIKILSLVFSLDIDILAHWHIISCAHYLIGMTSFLHFLTIDLM